MSIFFFLGAITIGPQVVETLGRELVQDPSIFTMQSNVAVLFFIGGALFIGNYAGVPASTSMTAVGAIAALGLATGELDWAVMGEIVVWWIVARSSASGLRGSSADTSTRGSTPGSRSRGTVAAER